MRKHTSPPGGASTIRGIEYQILGSLFELTKIQVENLRQASSGQVTHADITLEPVQLGGDCISRRNDHRKHIQFKSRNPNSPWSFKLVLEDVLPNLLKSVDLNLFDDFVFSTNGRLGNWINIAEWIAEFRTRQMPRSMEDYANTWNSSRFIKLPCGILDKAKGDLLREQEFFDLLTKQLMGTATNSDLQSHQTLWRLFSGMEFRWERGDEYWQEVVISFLSSLIPDPDKRKDMLDLMLRRVQVLAMQGDQVISSEEFFGEFKLNLNGWFEWKNLLASSKEALDRKLRTRRYVQSDDARRAANANYDQDVLKITSRFTPLKGRSGQGKSWELSSRAVAWSEKIPVLIEKASDSAIGLKTELERRFATEVLGRTDSLQFEKYPELIAKVHPDYASHWLTIAVDQVESAGWIDDLYQLLNPIEGIRVIVASQSDPADEFLADAPEDIHEVEIENFSDQELACFLTDGDLGRFYGMEPKLQETLKLPILASLYKKVDSNGFRPESEYQLYDHYFQRLYKRLGTVNSALVKASLSRASLAVARNEKYPWSIADLNRSGLTPELIQTLVDFGLLITTHDGEFEIWHDRILEWLLAEAKVDQLLRNEIRATEFADNWIFDFNNAPQHKNFSGYWLMDTLWILASTPSLGQTILSDLFAELETRIHRFDSFVEKMLSTLGNTITPTIISRLQFTQGNSHAHWRHRYVDFVVQFPLPEVVPFMLSNIEGASSEARESAYDFFKDAPGVVAIEPLWQRYLKVSADSGLGYDYRSDEKPDNFRESRDVWSALYSCLPLSREYLESKLAEPENHPTCVSLLLAVLRKVHYGKELWLHYKAGLIEFLLPKDRYQRAWTAGEFNDLAEVPWLRSVLDDADYSLPSEALSALVRINQEIAIHSIRDCDPYKVYLSRNRIIEPLCYLRYEEVMSEVERLMASNPNELASYVQWFIDIPNLLTTKALDLILDGLEVKLVDCNSEQVWPWMQTLEGITRPDLLTVLAGRAGTKFEQVMVDMLVNRAKEPGSYHDSTLTASVTVLQKFSSAGVAKLANHWLKSGDRFVRMAAFDLIPYGYDSATLDLIRAIITEPTPSGERPYPLGNIQDALAIVQEWPILIESILRRSMESSQEVANYRPDNSPIPDSELSQALSIWQSNRSDRGAIMALGFAQRAEFGDDIATVLRDQPEEDSLFSGCLWSLNMMPELSQQASDILADIANRSENWLAIRALEVAGTLESKLRLIALVESVYQKPVELPIGLDRIHTITNLTEHLLLLPETALRVQELCLKLVISGVERNVFARELINSMGLYALSTPQFEFLFQNSVVVEYCRTLAFQSDSSIRFVGNKRNAVRGLSVSNPSLAFSATLRIVQTASAHDRELAPFDLLRYDKQQGIKVLLAEFLAAKDEVFRTYIGIALAPHVDRAELVQDLVLTNDAIVKRAAFLLSLQNEAEKNLFLLTPLISHPNREVRLIVLDSIRRLHCTLTAQHLVTEIAGEEDRFRRYVLIDCLASTVYPELEYCGMPDILAEVLMQEGYAIREEMREKVKKRQKDLQRDLERQNRP
ncbi:MAG: hypothetical protein GC165_00130 [Armatimonadetes bacterium]|nr:hypothetical protein [Armatimonadota bacterium]